MHVFDEIAALATPLLINYETDLAHDREWINDHPEVEFIHVTRESGTHIFEIPIAAPLIEDNPIPYLFSTARPSEIYRQVGQVMAGQLKRSGLLWLVFDGKQVRKRTADACIDLYRRKRRAASREARQCRNQQGAQR